MFNRRRATISAGAVTLCAIVIFIYGINRLRHYIQELPDIEKLEDYTPSLVTKIYDRNGDVIDELFIEKRTLIPISDLPVDLQNAVLAIEDTGFFNHWGIDFQAILRALFTDIRHMRVVQGGSTITQQLAKVLFLTRAKVLERKIKELLLALQLERDYSKQEILQFYLNQIYFGKGAYGVEAASRLYFGKSVRNINLAEAALLAGLPRAPNYYSPFADILRAYKRRSTVLKRMLTLRYITEDEFWEANNYPIILDTEDYPDKNAPYFIEYVRQYLEAAYGPKVVHRGGLKVYTTLDLEMHKTAQAILKKHLEIFDRNKEEEIKEEIKKGNKEAYETFIKDKDKKIQGCLMAIDPSNGQILVMVGGRDFSESQFNRCVQARRQPGSAFKPFIYTAALDSGYTLASIIEDSPVAFFNDGTDWKLLSKTTDLADIDPEITIRIEDEKLWIPQNYKKDFRGPTILRDALRRSVNVCAIKLLDRIRPLTAIKYARKMGIESPLGNNLSLALGSSEVLPIEIISAFGIWGNRGIHAKPYAITKVIDNNGNIMEENFPVEEEALSAQVAYLMTYALQQVCETGTGWYTRYLKRPRAGKTGTTNEFTDAWFIGFVPDLVAGVWIGYDDNTTMGDKKAGGVIAAPVWTDFMKEVLEGKPVSEFSVPSNIIFAKIDPKTGLLALENTEDAVLVPFIRGTEPREYSMETSPFIWK